MSVTNDYSLPADGERDWGDKVRQAFAAISTGVDEARLTSTDALPGVVVVEGTNPALPTVNAAHGFYKLTVTDDTTVELPIPAVGRTVTLAATQDSTGGHTITLPDTAQQVEPDSTALAGVTQVFEWRCYDGVQWVLFNHLALNVPAPATEFFADDFSGTLSKWRKAGGGEVVHANITSGQLVVPCRSDYAAGIESADVVDLTDSWLAVEVIERPAQEAGTTMQFGLRNDTDDGDRIAFYLNGDGGWSAEAHVDDAWSHGQYGTYNPTSHKYLRIRHADTSVYWEASADGESWSQLGTVETPEGIDITNMRVWLGSGYYNTIASPGNAIFDNVLSDLTVTAAVETPSASKPFGQSGAWDLIFEDTFEGSSLDTDKWKEDGYWWGVGGSTNDGNNEQQWYLPSQVSVSDGTLKLTAEPEDSTHNGRNYQYKSGCIITGPNVDSEGTRFEFTYGYAEARIKVPKDQGLWPAFWLMRASGVNDWPPEIDVMEYLGHEPTKVHMTYHYKGANGSHQQSGQAWSGPDFSLDWHVFGVEWSAEAIRWYVDGVERRSAFTDTARITDEPLYVLLNLAVGGNWPGSPNGSTRFPAVMEVDYVRCWERSE